MVPQRPRHFSPAATSSRQTKKHHHEDRQTKSLQPVRFQINALERQFGNLEVGVTKEINSLCADVQKKMQEVNVRIEKLEELTSHGPPTAAGNDLQEQVRLMEAELHKL